MREFLDSAALLLAAFGLAYIVGHAKVSVALRKWAHDWVAGRLYPLRWAVSLAECAACFGFWEGVVWSWLNGGSALQNGCAVCASNLILAVVTGLMR